MMPLDLSAPTAPPRDLRCAYFQCGAKPDILGWIVSGDADSMWVGWEGLCKRHAPEVLNRMVREMLEGGACKSALIVLP
jgi:hypothetical protein